MTDNIISFGNKGETTSPKPTLQGPEIRTYRITYVDGEQHDATGVLVTTSSFVAVGTYTEDEKGVNFEAYAPISIVKHVHRLTDA